MIRTTEHTVVVDVERPHKVASENRVLLARFANEDELRCNVREEVTENENQQEATPDVGSKRG